jgi:hypothetical protein
VSDKVHRIHSLPGDAPWDGGLPPVGSPEHPRTIRALDRVLAIQRPVVLAHLRSIRLRHPEASTLGIVRILERRYLAAVTTGGAAVGATAVVPGIGTGVTLALSGVETLGFLESTALFAQSIAEVHGVAVEDPERARALVLTLMLGREGVDLLAQLAGQASGRGPDRSGYWGQMITKTLPRAAIGPLVDRLKTTFVHQFAARATTSSDGACSSVHGGRSVLPRSPSPPTSSPGRARSGSSTRQPAAWHGWAAPSRGLREAPPAGSDRSVGARSPAGSGKRSNRRPRRRPTPPSTLLHHRRTPTKGSPAPWTAPCSP